MEKCNVQSYRKVSGTMDGLNLKASAKVKVTKKDQHGNVIGVEEHEVDLTKEEAEALWQSQQQE